MEHFFQKGTNTNSPTFLILHGTGGTERDLLPIAQFIDPSAAVLGVRGNVSENGMARYFRRIREGVFDEEDLIARTKELVDFLNDASETYQFDRNNMIAIGYSNGANIAGSLLFHYQSALKHAILFHPMVPRRDVKVPNLSGSQIFIGAGKNDPLISQDETNELMNIFEQANGAVTIQWEILGHQLSESEVNAAKKWYNKL